MLRLRALLPALVLLLLGASCATGTTEIDLRRPRFPRADAPATTSVTLLEVRDARPDTARVGVKRNTRDDEVGDAVLENAAPLSDLVEADLIQAFASSGFVLRPATPNLHGDGAPALTVEVRRLWSEFRPGRWGRKASAEIELLLSIRRPAGSVQTHSFEGSASASSGAGSSTLLDAVLNGAYADVMKAIAADLDGGSLGDALRGAR